MVRRVDVALLPAEAAAIEADAFVVIDVLRATTTIATMFEQELEDLLVLDDIAVARARAAAEQRLLFGEVGGLPPEGFDHGNSPVEAGALQLRGQRGALFTTNGTGALCAVAGLGAVATAALANLTAAAQWAAAFERVALVCAGEGGGTRFALEDFAAAARMVHLLGRESPGVALGDAAAMAAEVPGYVAGSEHGRELQAIGLASDIAFAAHEDTSGAVPVVVEQGEGWARLRDGR